ncbi:MAG: hypothetical protein ACXIUV_07880 [Alkalilacustris sp.]
MSRTEFIVVTTLVLFLAFALGWFAHWLVHRFARIGDTDMGELDRMAAALHEAEEMRDKALGYVHDREQELLGQLAQTEAELRAAMDGLRSARQELHDLQLREDLPRR